MIRAIANRVGVIVTNGPLILVARYIAFNELTNIWKYRDLNRRHAPWYN